jgi:phenylalanyl-tRNA synthetase beta chain
VALDDKLPVKISAPDLCGRFSGRIVRNVNTQAKTPQWMVDRLARCGQRSVTPLVDISNYVMFELGRPSHIFDLDKIHGGLDVRWGKAGEQLKLLNGNTVDRGREGRRDRRRPPGRVAGRHHGRRRHGGVRRHAPHLRRGRLLVAQGRRRPLAPLQLLHRRRPPLRARRGPELTVEHIERITQLVIEICGTPETACGPVDDQQVAMPQPQPVTLRVARAAKVIGMPLTQAQCADALQGLGLPVTLGDGTVTVAPPSYRFDLAIEEDLIEEVARMVGYNHLPTTPPLAPITPKLR